MADNISPNLCSGGFKFLKRITLRRAYFPPAALFFVDTFWYLCNSASFHGQMCIYVVFLYRKIEADV